MSLFKQLWIPSIILTTFWIVAIVFWRVTGTIFLLFNFGYIGTSLFIGLGLYTLLPLKRKPFGRRLTQLLIGLYMLVFLGFFKKENMQIEGFFIYLLSGMFMGSVIHYAVAKLFGPLLFGRGFCAWACWTSMVLDFLPYKNNKKSRIAVKWEKFRYIHFFISLTLILLLWFVFEYRPEILDNSELAWLIIGNAFYFVSSIVMAFMLKDNRAFCKYLCPITVIMKLTSRFALLKIKGDQHKCTQCGVCNNKCPMDINVMEYVKNGKRVLSTECIFCLTCISFCPEKILKESINMDVGGQEIICRRTKDYKC